MGTVIFSERKSTKGGQSQPKTLGHTYFLASPRPFPASTMESSSSAESPPQNAVITLERVLQNCPQAPRKSKRRSSATQTPETPTAAKATTATITGPPLSPSTVTTEEIHTTSHIHDGEGGRPRSPLKGRKLFVEESDGDSASRTPHLNWKQFEKMSLQDEPSKQQ